ncbi:hypothetical protein L9F63_026997 [Diploptera punctata]|nr:hypothetical protein L9F63_026997 [Diploptera punctata]
MNTPEYTTKYSDIPSKTLSRKSLKTINVSKPNISTRQLLQASSKLSTNGQSALKHYARSSAAVSINGGDISSRSGFAGPDNYGAPQSGFYFPGQTGYPGDGQVSASASASLTPRGGFGSVSISPPPQGNPELATRMGSVPVSGGGGNFAVMSSSSSSSSDIDGVKKTFKEATSVINDNGKVTTFHVRDPQ